MRGLVVVVTLAVALAAAGCSSDGGAGTAEGHGDDHSVAMTPPPLPPDPGAVVDLRGFHEGRMHLPQPTSVRFEPDTGLLEINFVSDDGGQVFVRVRDVVPDEATAATIAFEIAEHVSPPNKRLRRYQSSGDECQLTLSGPFEVGSEVTGTFVCQHVSGERGNREDLAGAFRSGIPLPAEGRAEAQAP